MQRRIEVSIVIVSLFIPCSFACSRKQVVAVELVRRVFLFPREDMQKASFIARGRRHRFPVHRARAQRQSCGGADPLPRAHRDTGHGTRPDRRVLAPVAEGALPPPSKRPGHTDGVRIVYVSS